MSVSEPIPIRFGKQILKNSIKFSEPNWIRFGNKKQYLSPEKIPNRIQFGSEKSSIILEEKILAKTSFCGEWNLEFGSNTTTSFHQLKNMWNLSQILTDFEKSVRIWNLSQILTDLSNLAQIPQILSADFGWRVVLWTEYCHKFAPLGCLCLCLCLFWSCHVFSSLWSNVSIFTSL